MALLPKGRFAPAARKWGGTRGTQNSGTVALIYPAQPPVRQEPVDGLLQNLSVAIPLCGMQPLEGNYYSTHLEKKKCCIDSSQLVALRHDPLAIGFHPHDGVVDKLRMPTHGE